MTRKINLNFMAVIAVAVFLTVVLTNFVSYRLFQQEVFSDLSSVAGLVQSLDLMEQMKQSGFVEPESELRLTWIAGDGTVLYDSFDNGTKDNHADRPEVRQALESGRGTAVRKSRTMDQSNFLYAKKAADGTVIRIAKEAGSIWKIYRSTLPAMALAAACSFAVTVWLARYLTKALVRPVAWMAENMDHLDQMTVYKELAPFITRIRTQHEEMLKNAKLRQEFTANVSHELKTPLTSISGYAELIASGMASKKKARHFAAEIHGSAKRLLVLINDILQLSELEDPAGENYFFQTVDLSETARQCVEQMRHTATKHGISLSFQGTPLYVRADRHLMEELICNLCDNAIRYNKKGGHVWVTVTDRLQIEDDGIGIPSRYQKRVFERFFRVDKSRSRKTGGTGLGLAIVKHITQVHGAQLSLESEEGDGTIICVDFPVM